MRGLENFSKPKWERLEQDENLDLWHDKIGAKDRRILMTKWAGEAWKELSKDMDLFTKLFQKTGCFILLSLIPENLLTFSVI